MNCPDNIQQVAAQGQNSAIVTYTATPSGGTGQYGPVAYNPNSGSSFNVGTTRTVQAFVQDSANTLAQCSFTVTVTSSSKSLNFELDTLNVSLENTVLNS